MVFALFGKVLFLITCFRGGGREGVGRFGYGNGVCMGVHFADVEWLGILEVCVG